MKLPSQILTVARHLGDLRERVVFVGGMICELLVTDPAAAPARPTDDVDIIVDVPSRADLIDLNEELRGRGFREDSEEGAPICRWRVDGLRVDVMPIDPALFGFSNVWYLGGIEHATRISGSEGTIRVLDAPHFCATKIEAYASRGGGDLFHHDLEDVITLVDGRESLVAEIEAAPSAVRDFLAHAISELLAQESFLEALPGHFRGDDASQARRPIVLSRLRSIAGLGAAQESPRLGASTRRAQFLIPGTSTPLVPMEGRALLRSSNVRAVAYDVTTSTLVVEFHKGGVYSYEGVPATVHAGLLAAASAGQYHHNWIKNRYRFRRLPSGPLRS